jgi:hypothetical protein
MRLPSRDPLAAGGHDTRRRRPGGRRKTRLVGLWPTGSTGIARRRTATSRRARPRWRHSLRAGGGDQRRGASRAGNSATVAAPGPAPKSIIALSSGWLAIRPRWIVHRCYSGPWRPRRGHHHRDLDRPRELFVMLHQVRAGRPTPRFRTIQVCLNDLSGIVAILLRGCMRLPRRDSEETRRR